MLIPKFCDKSFQNIDKTSITSQNTLDKVFTFLLNNWQSAYAYQTLY